MSDKADETPDVSEAGRWLIRISGLELMLFAFTSELAARAAYMAMSHAIVLADEGADMWLEERDENGNWITVAETHLP